MRNTKVYRDWGWAPNFADAIHRINTSQKRSDYIIATENSISLDAFIKKAFSIRKIKKDLGWKL